MSSLDFIALISQGEKLEDLLYETNSMLGPVLFVEFTLSVWNLVFCLFYAALTFTAFRSDGFKPLVFYYGCGSITWGILTTYRMACLIYYGTKLTNVIARVKKQLQV